MAGVESDESEGSQDSWSSGESRGKWHKPRQMRSMKETGLTGKDKSGRPVPTLARPKISEGKDKELDLHKDPPRRPPFAELAEGSPSQPGGNPGT